MGDEHWKEELMEILGRAGVVGEDYTGRLIINLNQGGITEVEKIEKIATPGERTVKNGD